MDDGSNCYWVISGQAFKDALDRVSEGEDPDLIYIEYYANCEYREVFGDDDDG